MSRVMIAKARIGQHRAAVDTRETDLRMAETSWSSEA